MQLGIEGRTFVENKTVAFVVSAATFLKILEDAAFELINVLVASVEHIRPSLFASNAAGAKYHDRLVGQRFGKFVNGLRENAKVVDTDRHGILKRAEADFVVVTCIK